MVENYQEMLSSEHSGFIRHNDIRVVSVDEEKSVLTADVTPENSNIWGGVHGGFLYAMADTAAGAFARINYGQHNVTLNGSINYLRSTVQSKALTAVGRPVRVGGHIGFFEVNITDDTGALIARAEIFAVNYGLRDIGRLPVQAHLQRQLAARGKLFHGVAHLRAQLLEYGFHVHAGLGGDLTRHQNLCVRSHNLDGRPRAGIALEVLAEQHVRELVAELVRVASPHGLGGHETGLCRSVSVFFVHTFSPHSS